MTGRVCEVLRASGADACYSAQSVTYDTQSGRSLYAVPSSPVRFESHRQTSASRQSTREAIVALEYTCKIRDIVVSVTSALFRVGTHPWYCNSYHKRHRMT